MNEQDPKPTPQEQDEMKVLSLLLGELSPDEAQTIRRKLAVNKQLAAYANEMEQTLGIVREATQPTVEGSGASTTDDKLDQDRREKVLKAFKTPPTRGKKQPRPKVTIPWARVMEFGTLFTVAIILTTMLLPNFSSIKVGADSEMAMMDVEFLGEEESVEFEVEAPIPADGLMELQTTAELPQQNVARTSEPILSSRDNTLFFDQSGPQAEFSAPQSASESDRKLSLDFGRAYSGKETADKPTYAFRQQNKQANAPVPSPVAKAKPKAPDSNLSWMASSLSEPTDELNVQLSTSTGGVPVSGSGNVVRFDSGMDLPAPPEPLEALAAVTWDVESKEVEDLAKSSERHSFVFGGMVNGTISEGAGGGGAGGGGFMNNVVPTAPSGIGGHVVDSKKVKWADRSELGYPFGTSAPSKSESTISGNDVMITALMDGAALGIHGANDQNVPATANTKRYLLDGSLANYDDYGVASVDASGMLFGDREKQDVPAIDGGLPATGRLFKNTVEKGNATANFTAPLFGFSGVATVQDSTMVDSDFITVDTAVKSRRLRESNSKELPELRGAVVSNGFARGSTIPAQNQTQVTVGGRFAMIAEDEQKALRDLRRSGNSGDLNGREQFMVPAEQPLRLLGQELANIDALLDEEREIAEQVISVGKASEALAKQSNVSGAKREFARRGGQIQPLAEGMEMEARFQRTEIKRLSRESQLKEVAAMSERDADQLAAAEAKVTEVMRRVSKPIELAKKKAQPQRSAPQPQAAEKQIREEEPPAPAAPKRPKATPRPEVNTSQNAFSTFSLNVSDVSYKLAKAALENGSLPESTSVRSEEFVNAMEYHDPCPANNERVAFAWDHAANPFAHNRDLIRFSVQTAAAGREAGQPLNLVLLLDNSGSMERPDRIAIVRNALGVLAQKLTPRDRISVVVFARTPRLWVDGMKGGQPAPLLERLSHLTPEGGTNLEAALRLAYETAQKYFQPTANNRVILLTDGAANLGDVEPESLKTIVETHRKKQIATDGFGVGWDGYNDHLLETITRNGDGRYGFLNDPQNAPQEFASLLAGALTVAASNVKAQVEFNPERVSSWRQIGYKSHQLTKEQFRDNTVDAAEIAAKESGTALYSVQINRKGKGPIGTVRLRYKIPATGKYVEESWPLPYNSDVPELENASHAIRVAASASAFAEHLAQNPHAANVQLSKLQGYLNGISDLWTNDPRLRELSEMIQQARILSGE